MSGAFGNLGPNTASEESSSLSLSSLTSDNMLLPLFNSVGDLPEIPADFGWSSFKASLEAQMPQKIWGMNYQQRFQVFCMLLVLSALFFALGFIVGLPTITFRPQKFALCFTFGSLLFMLSFALLKGPMDHVKSLVTDRERLPFTVVYVGSMLFTLYCTFTVGGLFGYVAVVGASGVQLLSLVWYLISFLPGGTAGLNILTTAILTLLKPVLVVLAKAWAWIMTRCLSCCVRRATGS